MYDAQADSSAYANVRNTLWNDEDVYIQGPGDILARFAQYRERRKNMSPIRFESWYKQAYGKRYPNREKVREIEEYVYLMERRQYTRSGTSTSL